MEFSPSGQQFGINTVLSGTEDSNILPACTKCNLFFKIKLNPPKYISNSYSFGFAFMPVSLTLIKHLGKMKPPPAHTHTSPAI